MSNKINRTKTGTSVQVKGLGKRGIAIVLCFVMLLTALGTGSLLSTAAVSQSDDSNASEIAMDAGSALVKAAANGADAVTASEADEEPFIDDIEDGYDIKASNEADKFVREDDDLAETGDTTYYYHYGTGNNYWSSNGVAMTHDGSTWYADVAFTTQYNNYIRINETSSSINTSDSTSVSSSSTNNYSSVVDKITYNGNVDSGYAGYKIELKSAPSTSTTVRISFNTSDTSTLIVSNPSGSGSGGSGGGNTGGGTGTKVTDSGLIDVLKGDAVRFYAKTYKGSNTGLHDDTNNSSGFKDCLEYLGSTGSGDNIRKYFIAHLLNSEKSTYKRITDSNTWSGNQNESITTSAGGEYYNGTAAYTTAGASGSTIGTVADAATTIESSYKFYEVMHIATVPDATVTSYGSDLLIRYYIKSGSDFYELDDIGDLAADTNGLSSSFDLTDLGVGSYTLLTVGISNIDSGDRNKCMAYILDSDDFTVTNVITGAPTTNEVSGKLIINSSMSPTCIWRWTSGSDGTVVNLTPHGTVSSRNLYDVAAVTNPGAILFKGTHTDGSGWPGNDDLLSDDIGPATGAATGVYYIKYDSGYGDPDWQSFSHISTELTINSSTDAVTIGTGDTVTITNTPGGTLATPGEGTDKNGLSASANQAKYVYYVVDPEGTATRINSSFTTSATYDFTPTTAGTYKVFSYVQDMWGYETALSNNIMIINVQQAYKVTVKTNSSRLGTGTADPVNGIPGNTVNITINDNMGQFSAISVKDASGTAVSTTTVTANEEYTFVMPSSAATVNLTFAEMSGTSDFYYNGYDTNGSPLENFYGKQMSLGKVGGETYSYYHVTDRTGTDQLFTVSYNNPVYNSYNTYFSIYTGWESGGVAAQFYATDGNNLGDWKNMTFDGWDSSDKKKFRIAIPDGAKSVQFRSNAGNQDKTGILSLTDGKNGWYTSGSKMTDLTSYNQSNPVPVNFYEHFYDSSKYTSTFDTNGFYQHNANRGASHAYIKPKDLGTSADDYYIVVLYENRTYVIDGVSHPVTANPEVIWMKKLPGAEDIDASSVDVYAKDGPIVIDWNNKSNSGATTTSGTAYGYSLIADTMIYDSEDSHIGLDHDDDGASYESASVEVTADYGTDVIIKTTLNSSYTSKYYLKGWCVNGETYACGDNVKGVNAESAGTASGSDKLYTMTYTVPAGTADKSKIEITPIYYLLSSYKSTYSITTVTFYLEGYSAISDKWGDTPYIYPFYGNLNNVDNSFGVYPGQPMVYADGQYSVEVPVNKNVPIAKTPGSTAVKGITINNGYADHVHRNLVYKWSDHDNDADHKQTYDYDDFYKIYEECLKNDEHPNAIFFRIQDEDTVYNRSEYGGGKSGQFASGTDNITISDIASSGNGWELLVNRYGHAVNIFGDQSAVSDPGSGVTATSDTSNAIYVVSTGYNANIAGDYGTMWKVYNGNGQLISNGGGRYGITPSVLVMQGSSSGITNKTGKYPSAERSVEGVGSYKDSISDYEAIYKSLKSSYNAKRVYITYEKDAQDTRKEASGTGAYRLDGRWYYTHASDNVSSKIGIEYWDETNAVWVTDSMTGTRGEHTDCTAQFDNNSTTSPTYTIQNNQTYSFNASPSAGWKFDSWQIKYSATSYDQISTNRSATMPATASYEIIARFVPVVSGSLTINHTLNSASSGEGTVTMAVNVYTDSTLGTKVPGFSEKTGSRVYLDDTYINNDNTYYIKVELKTTPMYDGKVSAFTYDSFNTTKSIEATTDTLPGDENTLTTSTFSFPVSDLYNVGTQSTKVLNYTSLIDETLHYYNFVYTFTDRAGASKSYTSKGVLNLTEYKKVVSDQAAHTLDSSFLVTKAPFESNFLKKNTLSKGEITWDKNTHTYSATSTFDQQDDVPKYHVIFDLPYSYYSAADLTLNPAVKKYTVQPTNGVKVYNASTDSFDLLAEYNTFVTVGATDTAVGSQSRVSKVTDGSDVNHTGNDFITAPDELMAGSTTMYFKYWEVRKLKADGSAGDLVTYLYYPDFNYRVYSDYYVEAVYSDQPTDSWHFNYSEDVNTAIDCSVLYLGDSRNQWNSGSAASSTSSATAADKIYNDFIFHYTYKGQELKNSSSVEVGMILERATYMDGETQKWLAGSTSVNDMNYYRSEYGGSSSKSTESARKTAIETALSGSTALPSGTIMVTWNNDELNDKNFTEQNYNVFSQYGQTVANNTITFANDNVIDNYVYRAYAYVKDGSGYTLSDPVYFCMRYTSNLKYSE